MRVWVVAVGEPLPIDEERPRLLRAGIIATMLAERGHEVTWWTSRFNHHAKSMRNPRQAEINPNLSIELLEGGSYASNVSLARLRNHRQIAQDFRLRAAAAPRPDVILCSFPTIELSLECGLYGRARGVPVLLDIRDMWPDIFLNLAPRPLQPLVRPLLSGMERDTHRACAAATSIIGITEPFVDWGVQKAGRARRPDDFAVPLAYDAVAPSPAELAGADRFWRECGVTEGGLTIAFFGTLGRQFDIDTVIEAARLLRGDDVRFVICGTGDRLERYRSAASDLTNVIFPGWVDKVQIWSLMKLAQAGLAPYYCEDSFTKSIPNKAIEYLAGGLPIITCLRGELSRLLNDHGCGVTYEEQQASSLVAAARSLAASPSQLTEMRQKALQIFESRFTASSVYGDLCDRMTSLAASFARGSDQIRERRSHWGA